MTPEPTGRLRGNDLVVTRRFRASPEDVWTSITDPASTERWYGRWEGTPGVGEQIRVQMAFEEGQPWFTKTIEVCEPPRRLVLSSTGQWGMRIELGLTPTADGCELALVHHAVDRKMVGDFGPGWEYYLDNLVAARDGTPLPAFATYYPAQKPYYQGLTAPEQ
jgi:uncharacterized protein YndB with AHSA1/START domain